MPTPRRPSRLVSPGRTTKPATPGRKSSSKKPVVARTDHDIANEVAGKARIELAEQSKQRQEAEAAALAAENARVREMIQTTGPKIDDNIDDDEAGRMRHELADQSKQRMASEATMLAEENRSMRERITATGTRTDYDISDDAAGRARSQLAEASKQRKAAAADELERSNLDFKERMRQIRAATDVDISDEAAGIARREMAQASKQRRAQEREAIRQANIAMRRRLKNVKARTDDGDGGGDTAMFPFGIPPGELKLEPLERDSTLTVAQYLKFQDFDEKRQMGDMARLEKAGHKNEIRKAAADWKHVGANRVRERRKRDENTRKLRTELQLSRQSDGRALREDEKAWEARREQELLELHAAVRVRVHEARTLDSRLDFSESQMQNAARVRYSFRSHPRCSRTHDNLPKACSTATRACSPISSLRTLSAHCCHPLPSCAHDACAACRPQEEGSRLNEARKILADEIHQQGVERRKESVDNTIASRASLTAALHACSEATRRIGDEKRDLSKSLRRQKSTREDAYLARARENRERAAAIREAAKESVQQMLRDRKRTATKERKNDDLVVEARARVIEGNRREVAAMYRNRFVGRDEESEWEASSLHRLQRQPRGGAGWRSWRSSSSAPSPEIYI